MRRTGQWIVAVVAITCVTASVLALFAVSEADSAESIASVTLTDIVRRLELVGTVMPKQRVGVLASVPGRVKRVYVKRGDRVGRGAPLLELDGQKSLRDLRRREIALERARYRLAQQIEQGRTAIIEELDVRQAELDVAEALEAFEAMILRAPSEGVVVQIPMGVGDFMAAGGGPSNQQIVLADSNEVIIEVEADEFEASSVKSGLKALVWSDANGGVPVGGRVLGSPVLRRPRGGPSVSAQFAFTVVPDAPLEGAYFGMSGRIELEVARLENVPAVPLAAILRAGDHNEVVVVEQGKRVPVRVGLGLSDDFMVQLVDGPVVGTRIVTGDEATLRAVVQRR